MRVELTDADRVYEMEVETRSDEAEVVLDRKKMAVKVEVMDEENGYFAKVAGRSMPVHLEEETESSITLTLDGETVEFEIPRASAAVKESHRGESAHVGGQVLQSPMPGRVISVQTRVGQDVKANAPIVVMESMKMESVVRSSRNGKIAEVLVKPGDVVNRGQALVRFS